MLVDEGGPRTVTPAPWVLVVADPAAIPAGLCAALCGAGYGLVVRTDAGQGMLAARDATPGAIVCDLDLPDADGLSFARWVRARDALAATPLVLLSSRPGLPSRLEALRAGADACAPADRPPAAIVAQIGALVRMAARLRRSRASLEAPRGPSRRGLGIEGDLAIISAATMLTILDLERRSGVFEVRAGRETSRLVLQEGAVVSAAVARAPERGEAGPARTVPAVEAAMAMVGHDAGRFAFVVAATSEAPACPGSPARALVAEALRRCDESRRAPGEPGDRADDIAASHAEPRRERLGSAAKPPPGCPGGIRLVAG